MPSIHTIRWIENLKDTTFELYWFDIMGRGNIETINSIKQFTDWKQRKITYLKGEYFLSKKLPLIYSYVEPLLQITANEMLEEIIMSIQPDVVHSFEMQECSYPILKTMKKFPNLKWIYSCWGSDLYYYKQFPLHLKNIKLILERVDYLHTDCLRDYKLAKQLGFSGKHLGVIPGGTGYKLDELINYRIPFDNRKVILVKGYQHRFGRGLNIVKALQSIENQIKDYDVIVFGSHSETIEYIKSNSLNFKFYGRHGLSQQQLIALMGKSIIYIGNSISDGMPNTLLEAIIMGAFPIQSNPGGVSEEIINDTKNGLLIENPESFDEIKNLIIKAISNPNMMQKAQLINFDLAMKNFDYEVNRMKVIRIYETIYDANIV
jgi:glycosyltransferase involved in cell wall biosynthesis